MTDNTISWVIPLISALGGAIITMIIRELVEWYKRPRFKIDFEEREGKKPYIPDYNDESLHSAGDTYRVKYLRLMVHNKGKKPAMDCEAKLEVVLDEARNMPYNVALHWSRRDPALYSEFGEGGLLLSINNEKVYAPISLNVNDKETLDVFILPYCFSTTPDTDHSPRFRAVIGSASFRNQLLQPKAKYLCKVTVYSSNANPQSFRFNVNWDGTLDGFSKAFTK